MVSISEISLTLCHFERGFCKLSYPPDKWSRGLAGVRGKSPRKLFGFGHFESQTKPISVGNFTFNLDDFVVVVVVVVVVVKFTLSLYTITYSVP